MKEFICAAIGVIGSFLASVFGGWDTALVTLLIFMGIDLVTGGIILPAIFKKSPKSENGALKSGVFGKGLCKKGVYLLIVLVAYRLDLTIETNYIRDAVIIAFITNELISILENAGLMGIPLPKVLTKAIDILTSKSDPGEGGNTDDK